MGRKIAITGRGAFRGIASRATAAAIAARSGVSLGAVHHFSGLIGHLADPGEHLADAIHDNMAGDTHDDRTWLANRPETLATYAGIRCASILR